MKSDLEKSFLSVIDNRATRIKMRDIGGKGYHLFQCEAFTYLPQFNSPEKYFLFERLCRIKTIGTISNTQLQVGDIEYRFLYYILGKNGAKKGEWILSRHSPTIPPSDFKKLIQKAKKDKVINE